MEFAGELEDSWELYMDLYGFKWIYIIYIDVWIMTCQMAPEKMERSSYEKKNASCILGPWYSLTTHHLGCAES